MNDYDKAGRYLVKRQPQVSLCWLLANPALAFHAWIDARRVALPNQNDLTNDLVAAVGNGRVLEAICLELEAEARADAVIRALGYVLRVWSEPGGEGSLPVTCVSAVILDLTGRSATDKLTLRSEIVPGCHLEFTVLRRNLAEKDATPLVTEVASGKLSPWLLGWVPLMQHGGEPAIIAAWRNAAERYMLDDRDRADLGSLALVLANLAGRRTDWEHGLRGWNMKTAPFLDEIRAEGREEGRVEGRIEAGRALLLRQGRRKFGAAPSRKQKNALQAVTDLGRLEALAERLLEVDSWADLLGDA